LHTQEAHIATQGFKTENSFKKQISLASTVAISSQRTHNTLHYPIFKLTPHGSVLYCVSKNIPDIFDCNLKIIYEILIIFGTNIHDTTCRQIGI